MPTYWDGIALAIDSPELSWMNANFTEFIALADIGAEESVLVLCCSTGELVARILQTLPHTVARRVVGIDEGRLSVQTATRKVDDLDYQGGTHPLSETLLLCGDPYDLNSIGYLYDESQPSAHTTFDIILVRDALPLDDSRYNEILRHWRTRRK